MDKFIIMNVHDATHKTPKIKLNFFPFFLLVYEKKSMLKTMIIIIIIIIIIIMENDQYLYLLFLFKTRFIKKIKLILL